MWAGYSEKGTGAQERGPGTFALQQPGAAPEARPATGQAVAVQAAPGRQGPGLTAPSVRVGDSVDRTMAELVKVGQDLLAPQIKKVTQERFIQGMTAAASGQAITEIVNEQPWYSRIFGDGPLVDGARAYEVQARADRWASGLSEQMPELRKRSPGEIPGFLVESLKAFQTGDRDTDTLLQAQMVKAIPQVIKQHTKEHYQYRQEDMLAKFSDGVLAASHLAHLAIQDPKATPEDRDAARLNVLAAFTPPAFMDGGAADKALPKLVGLMAEAGDFHAISTLRGAKVFEHMQPEQRLLAERAVNQFSEYHRTRGPAAGMLISHAEDIALVRSGKMSGEAWRAKVAEVNAKYAATTGNPAPLVSPAQEAQGVETAAQLMYMAQRQEQAKLDTLKKQALTDDLKAAAQQQVDAFWQKAAREGTIGTALAGHDGKKADADRGFIEALNSMPGKSPEDQAFNRVRMVVNASIDGYTNPVLKNQYGSLVRFLPETRTNGFNTAYSKWAELNAQPDSAPARAGYFGEEMDARMSAFHSMMQGQPASFADEAYNAALRNPLRRVEPTKEERAAVTKAINAEVGRFIPGRFGGTALSAEAAGVVEREVQGSLALYKGMVPELGLPEIAKRAVSTAIANGLEVYGGHAWKTPLGLARPLRDVLPRVDGKDVIDSSLIPELFNSVLSEQTAAALGDKKPERTALHRLPDSNGVAYWNVWYSGADGLLGSFQLNSTQLVAEHARRRQAGIAYRGMAAQAEDIPDITSPRTMFRQR